jgi:hypothetical protein
MARRDVAPNVVILEVLWNPAHRVRDLSVKKITEFLNTLLRSRGNRYEYAEEEVAGS